MHGSDGKKRKKKKDLSVRLCRSGVVTLRVFFHVDVLLPQNTLDATLNVMLLRNVCIP